MPYKLRGKCVVRSDTGAVVKCHADEEQARKHLAALKINVREAGPLGAVLEGFAANAGPVVMDGRIRPGDKVRVKVPGGESIVGRAVRPSDLHPGTHLLVAPEGGGPHVEAKVKATRHDTPEEQAADRARRQAEQETERQVSAPPPGEQAAAGGRPPAVQTDRGGLRAMARGQARLQPEAQRRRSAAGGVVEALVEAFNPSEPRGFAGRWIRIAGEIANAGSVGERFRKGDQLKLRTEDLHGAPVTPEAWKVHVVLGHDGSRMRVQRVRGDGSKLGRPVSIDHSVVAEKLDNGMARHYRRDTAAETYVGDALSRGERPAGGGAIASAAASAAATRAEILAKSPGAKREAEEYQAVLSARRSEARAALTGRSNDAPVVPGVTVGTPPVSARRSEARAALTGKRGRKVRNGTVVSEGVGVLLEGFAMPVTPKETPAQSRARAAGMLAQAKSGIADFNAKHPRAGHGRFTTKGGVKSSASKRATRATAGGPRILTVGTKGTLVRSIQRQLHLPATGTFDARTQAAIERYQRQHGLQVDGRVGAQTIASLRGNPNARQIKPGPIPYKAARVANPHKRRSRAKAPPAPVRLGTGVVV